MHRFRIALTFLCALVQLRAWAEPPATPGQTPRLVVQTGHTDGITAVAFAPDDLTLASASLDRTLRIWDVASRRELRTLIGHPGTLAAILYASDGKTLIAGDRAGNVKVWDPASGKNLLTVKCAGEFESSRFEVSSVAISSDGKAVAAACIDVIKWSDRARRSENLIMLWDMASGAVLQSFGAQSSALRWIGFSVDSKYLHAASDDGKLRIWDPATGQELGASAPMPHIGRVAVALSPDRRIIASAGSQHSLALIELANGQVRSEFDGNTADARALAFGLNGGILAAGDNDGVVKIWDVATKRSLGQLPKFRGAVTGLAFSNDTNKLLVGDCCDVWLWDLRTNEPPKAFARAGRMLKALALSPNGRLLAAGNGNNGGVTVWDLELGKPVAVKETIAKSNRHESGGVAFSPDGTFLASTSDDATRVWDFAPNSRPRLLTDSAEHDSHVLAFAPESNLLASAGHKLSLLDLASGRTLRTMGVSAPHAAYTSLAFSPTGKTIVSANTESGVEVWDANTGAFLRTLEQSKLTNKVAFFPNGRVLATGDHQGTIQLWDFDKGKVLATLESNDLSEFEGMAGPGVLDLAFSRDGMLLASAHDDKQVRLWDINDGSHLRTLVTHTSAVQGVTFTPDQRYLFSASLDGTICLWRVADGALLATLFSFADGRWAVTDNQGRFDVADLEDMPHIHWVMPDEPMTPQPIEIFMRDYYEPQLLTRLMRGEQFKPVRPMIELKRIRPTVRITTLTADAESGYVLVNVEVSGTRAAGQYTGAHDLRLFRNGQLVAHASGLLASEESQPHQSIFRVRLPAGAGPINFTAYAFNDDRIKSTTASATYHPPAPLSGSPPQAYLINVGVNRHDNPAWDLQYAANDAHKIGSSLGHRLKVRQSYEKIVTVTLVSDHSGQQLATKANLKAVLDVLAGHPVNVAAIPGAEKLRRATPDDLVLISFSGHGFTKAGQFYLVLSDTGPGTGMDASADLTKHAISSEELAEWLRDVDGGDMTMIVDACHSSASIGEQFKPGPMGSSGLGQLAFDKGMRILAASQANDVALESAQLKQGLLSFALVQNGLEERRADFLPHNDIITMDELMRYAVARVPVLAQELRQGKSFKGSRGIVLVVGNSGAQQRAIQQPSLFDFTKGRRDTVLEHAH